MKRKWFATLALAVTIVLLCCAAAPAATLIPPSQCRHNWSGWTVTKAATCGDEGTQSRECTLCGTRQTRVIPATGNHEWGEWEITKQPTETEPGVRVSYCKRCGLRRGERITLDQLPPEQVRDLPPAEPVPAPPQPAEAPAILGAELSWHMPAWDEHLADPQSGLWHDMTLSVSYNGAPGEGTITARLIRDGAAEVPAMGGSYADIPDEASLNAVWYYIHQGPGSYQAEVTLTRGGESVSTLSNVLTITGLELTGVTLSYVPEGVYPMGDDVRTGDMKVDVDYAYGGLSYCQYYNIQGSVTVTKDGAPIYESGSFDTYGSGWFDINSAGPGVYQATVTLSFNGQTLTLTSNEVTIGGLELRGATLTYVPEGIVHESWDYIPNATLTLDCSMTPTTGQMPLYSMTLYKDGSPEISVGPTEDSSKFGELLLDGPGAFYAEVSVQYLGQTQTVTSNTVVKEAPAPWQEPVPMIDLALTIPDAVYGPGDTVPLSFTVTNTGTVPLVFLGSEGFEAVSGLAFPDMLDVGQSGSAAGSYVLSAEDLANCQYVDANGELSAVPTDTPIHSFDGLVRYVYAGLDAHNEPQTWIAADDVSVQIRLAPAEDISQLLDISCDYEDQVYHPLETAAVTYTVTNGSAYTLTLYSQSGFTAELPETLEPGESRSWTEGYEITQGMIEEGHYIDPTDGQLGDEYFKTCLAVRGGNAFYHAADLPEGRNEAGDECIVLLRLEDTKGSPAPAPMAEPGFSETKQNAWFTATVEVLPDQREQGYPDGDLVELRVTVTNTGTYWLNDLSIVINDSPVLSRKDALKPGEEEVSRNGHKVIDSGDGSDHIAVAVTCDKGSLAIPLGLPIKPSYERQLDISLTCASSAPAVAGQRIPATIVLMNLGKTAVRTSGYEHAFHSDLNDNIAMKLEKIEKTVIEPGASVSADFEFVVDPIDLSVGKLERSIHFNYTTDGIIAATFKTDTASASVTLTEPPAVPAPPEPAKAPEGFYLRVQQMTPSEYQYSKDDSVLYYVRLFNETEQVMQDCSGSFSMDGVERQTFDFGTIQPGHAGGEHMYAKLSDAAGTEKAALRWTAGGTPEGQGTRVDVEPVTRTLPLAYDEKAPQLVAALSAPAEAEATEGVHVPASLTLVNTGNVPVRIIEYEHSFRGEEYDKIYDILAGAVGLVLEPGGDFSADFDMIVGSFSQDLENMLLERTLDFLYTPAEGSDREELTTNMVKAEVRLVEPEAAVSPAGQPDPDELIHLEATLSAAETAPAKYGTKVPAKLTLSNTGKLAVRTGEYGHTFHVYDERDTVNKLMNITIGPGDSASADVVITIDGEDLDHEKADRHVVFDYAAVEYPDVPLQTNYAQAVITLTAPGEPEPKPEPVPEERPLLFATMVSSKGVAPAQAGYPIPTKLSVVNTGKVPLVITSYAHNFGEDYGYNAAAQLAKLVNITLAPGEDASVSFDIIVLADEISKPYVYRSVFFKYAAVETPETVLLSEEAAVEIPLAEPEQPGPVLEPEPMAAGVTIHGWLGDGYDGSPIEEGKMAPVMMYAVNTGSVPLYQMQISVNGKKMAYAISVKQPGEGIYSSGDPYNPAYYVHDSGDGYDHAVLTVTALADPEDEGSVVSDSVTLDIPVAQPGTSVTEPGPENREPKLMLVASKLTAEPLAFDGMGNTPGVQYILTVSNLGDAACTVDYISVALHSGVEQKEVGTLLEAGKSVDVPYSHVYNETDLDTDGMLHVAFRAIGKAPYAESGWAELDHEVTHEPPEWQIPDETSVTLVKTVTSTGPYKAGDPISYALTVTNTSETAIPHLVLRDALIGPGDLTTLSDLKPHESRTFESGYYYIVTEPDIGTGQVYNIAKAIWEDPVSGSYLTEWSNPVTVILSQQTETAGAGDCCVLTLTAHGDGASRYVLTPCKKHAEMLARPATAEEWKAELGSLYAALAEKYGAEAVTAEQTAFLALVSAREALADGTALDLLTRQASELCYLLGKAPELPRPDSLRKDALEPLTPQRPLSECRRLTEAQPDGSLLITATLCDAHWDSLRYIEPQLMKADTDSAWEKAFGRAQRLYQDALNLRVTARYKAAPAAQRPLIAESRKALDAWMKQRKAFYTLIYPESPATVAELLARDWRDALTDGCR